MEFEANLFVSTLSLFYRITTSLKLVRYLQIYFTVLHNRFSFSHLRKRHEREKNFQTLKLFLCITNTAATATTATTATAKTTTQNMLRGVKKSY